MGLVNWKVCRCLAQFVCYLLKGKIVISVISFLLGRFCTQPWWSNTCFHFIPPELLVLLMVPIRIECTRLWTYLSRYEPDAPCWRRQMETFSSLLALCAVNSPHKCQWRGVLMFSLICAWTNGCANNRDAGDLRKPRAHYDATVMLSTSGVCVCVNHKLVWMQIVSVTSNIKWV